MQVKLYADYGPPPSPLAISKSLRTPMYEYDESDAYFVNSKHIHDKYETNTFLLSFP